jgi:hypothetical protein
MPTPHTFNSSCGASNGRQEGPTTRAAVNAIFQSSEALRRQAREDLRAAAQTRRRIARECAYNRRSETRAKEKDASKFVARLHVQRHKCTRMVRANLREFRSDLHSSVSAHISELASLRRRGTKSLSKRLAQCHSKNLEACQARIKALAAERKQDMAAMRKNLAEYMGALRDEVSSHRARIRQELGWT